MDLRHERAKVLDLVHIIQNVDPKENVHIISKNVNSAVVLYTVFNANPENKHLVL